VPKKTLERFYELKLLSSRSLKPSFASIDVNGDASYTDFQDQLAEEIGNKKY